MEAFHVAVSLRGRQVYAIEFVRIFCGGWRSFRIILYDSSHLIRFQPASFRRRALLFYSSPYVSLYVCMFPSSLRRY